MIRLPLWLVLGSGAGVIAIGYFAPRPTPASVNTFVSLFKGEASDGRGMSVPACGTAERCLVVAMGQCGSCSAAAYRPGMEAKGRYEKIVTVYRGPKSKYHKTLPGVTEVFDLDGKFHDTVKAAWTPRFFEAVKGRIETAQTQPASTHPFLAEGRP